MTEAEWLACKDPEPMVWLIRKRGSERRQRLAACACYRAAWRVIEDGQFEWVIEFGECFADGEIDSDTARAAFEKAMDCARVFINPQSLEDLDALTRMVGTALCVNPLPNALGMLAPEEPTRLQRIRKVIEGWLSSGAPDHQGLKPIIWSHLIRDIFGNPFRPVAFSPKWRTLEALALTRQMYRSRDFGAMPILADALQDAGCDNEDILDHCREPGPHVRGCWVVDLVLGKE